jgi:hypothetical protein
MLDQMNKSVLLPISLFTIASIVVVFVVRSSLKSKKSVVAKSNTCTNITPDFSSPNFPNKSEPLKSFTDENLVKIENTSSIFPASKKSKKEEYESVNNCIIIPIIHKNENNLSSLFGGSPSDDSLVCEYTFETIRDVLSKTVNKDIVLLINTNGGYVSWCKQICQALVTYKNKYTQAKIKVYIPYKALSAGSLIALMGDELYMNDYALLSPADPQIFGLNSYVVDNVIETKKEQSHDLALLVKKLFDQNIKLVDSIFEMCIRKNPKHENNIRNLKLSFLYCDRIHNNAYNISELEKINLKIDGLVPDDTMVVYDEIIGNKVEKPNPLDTYRKMFGLK